MLLSYSSSFLLLMVCFFGTIVFLHIFLDDDSVIFDSLGSESEKYR